MWDAIDAVRQSRSMTWRDVLEEMNSDAPDVSARYGDANHPMSQSTVTGMRKRGTIGCQHAFAMLRWLGHPPEAFMPGASSFAAPLPEVGPDRRLRWDIPALSAALDAERKARGLTWRQAADEIGCSVSQVTGLRTLRYGTGMNVTMRVTRWLRRPAADFAIAADW